MKSGPPKSRIFVLYDKKSHVFDSCKKIRSPFLDVVLVSKSFVEIATNDLDRTSTFFNEIPAIRQFVQYVPDQSLSLVRFLHLKLQVWT